MKVLSMWCLHGGGYWKANLFILLKGEIGKDLSFIQEEFSICNPGRHSDKALDNSI